LASLCLAGPVSAKDLGDILVEKGLITQDELRQAREEEKQKAAAEESRRDAITAKLPKWLAMVTPFGDVRLRTEGFYADNLNARTRERLRARLGLTVAPTDEVSATIRIASGNANDPISTNQSFQDTFSRKSINLDQAYLTVRPAGTFGLEPGWGFFMGGKMPVQAYRVSELVFDDDLSPEGAQEQLVLAEHREGAFRGLKVNGFQWVVDEFSSAGDPWMIGGQVVGDFAVGDKGPFVTLAFADYSYQSMNKVAAKFLEPTSKSYNSQLAISNDLRKNADGKITGFDSGFNILNLNGEVNFPNVWRTYGAGVFGELAHNTQADNRGTGFMVGAGFGSSGRGWYSNSLKNPGDWAVSYAYERVEQDAVPAMFSYSDGEFVTSAGSIRGSTNVQFSLLRLDYMLFPGFQLTAKSHFINSLDRQTASAATSGNATLIRTQLDATLKF
jgi:hypothetical protein